MPYMIYTKAQARAAYEHGCRRPCGPCGCAGGNIPDSWDGFPLPFKQLMPNSFQPHPYSRSYTQKLVRPTQQPYWRET